MTDHLWKLTIDWCGGSRAVSGEGGRRRCETWSHVSMFQTSSYLVAQASMHACFVCDRVCVCVSASRHDLHALSWW